MCAQFNSEQVGHAVGRGCGCARAQRTSGEVVCRSVDGRLSGDPPPPGRELRRCCMNRHWPARCPPTGSSPADAIRRWSAEGGHPIQDLTAEDDLTPLPGWAPGAKPAQRPFSGLYIPRSASVSGQPPRPTSGPQRGPRRANPPPRSNPPLKATHIATGGAGGRHRHRSPPTSCGGHRGCWSSRSRAGSWPGRLQDIESDTGYDTRRRGPEDPLAGVSQTAVCGMCCNFPKTARERLIESAWLRLMPPPRTSC